MEVLNGSFRWRDHLDGPPAAKAFEGSWAGYKNVTTGSQAALRTLGGAASSRQGPRIPMEHREGCGCSESAVSSSVVVGHWLQSLQNTTAVFVLHCKEAGSFWRFDAGQSQGPNPISTLRCCYESWQKGWHSQICPQTQLDHSKQRAQEVICTVCLA